MATTACCQRGVRQRGMAARAVEQLAAALREWIGRRGFQCDRKLIVRDLGAYSTNLVRFQASSFVDSVSPPSSADCPFHPKFRAACSVYM